ncbi:MAG: hypothetical protein WHS83_04345 [Chloroflexus sp.]|uniref:hypothetical protein n=1 Tax=Chloroflexus sp. TaxID=1904827 RepID=UPI00309E70D0
MARGVECGSYTAVPAVITTKGARGSGFFIGHGDDVRVEQVCQVWLTACEVVRIVAQASSLPTVVQVMAGCGPDQLPGER